MKTALSHANVIDCVEPKVRWDSAVLIEDGRIRLTTLGVNIAAIRPALRRCRRWS